MRKTYVLPEFDLQLFDSAAAEAPGGETGEGGQQDGAGALPKAGNQRRSGSGRRSRTGGYENVVFGKQEDAPAQEDTQAPDAGGQDAEGSGETSGVTTTSDTLEAKRAAFEEMISGEYKDVYTEKFNNYFNRRFKEARGAEEALAAQKPIMDMLMQRYGVADNNVGQLQAALEADEGYWQEAAEAAGMTVDQYLSIQRLERENAQLRQAQLRQQGEQQMQQQFARWDQEAQQVKALYPAFDFQAETGNRDFVGLLRAGLPVQKAYELVHMEEIKAEAAKAAAKTAGEQMAARIQARNARPAENGTSAQGAVIVKNDVHNLSRAERAEIARRVQRGEQIRF